jgi:hypothetical protein
MRVSLNAAPSASSAGQAITARICDIRWEAARHARSRVAFQRGATGDAAATPGATDGETNVVGVARSVVVVGSSATIPSQALGMLGLAAVDGMILLILFARATELVLELAHKTAHICCFHE